MASAVQNNRGMNAAEGVFAGALLGAFCCSNRAAAALTTGVAKLRLLTELP